MPRPSPEEDPFYHILQERDVFDGLTPPSDIILLRHGHFPRNQPVDLGANPSEQAIAELVDATHRSNDEIGLDDLGKEQARLVGDALLQFFPDGIQTCYTSPYLRAREMAALVLPNVIPRVDMDLAERSRGAVQGVPKELLEGYVDLINSRLPEDQRQTFDKDTSPLHWWPFEGEPYSLKAQWLRKSMRSMAMQAPGLPVLASTHGEVVITGRTVRELGNMGNRELQRVIAPGCSALVVDNGHFDWWTRRDPHTSILSPAFTHLRAINVCSNPVLDTGFLAISTLGCY